MPPWLSLSRNSLNACFLSCYIYLYHFFLYLMNYCVLLLILLAIPIILEVLVHILTSLLNALFILFLNCRALAEILFLVFILCSGLFVLKSMSVSMIYSSQASMYELVSYLSMSMFSVKFCSLALSLFVNASCLLYFAYLILFYSCPMVLWRVVPSSFFIWKKIGRWSLYICPPLMTLWDLCVSSLLTIV